MSGLLAYLKEKGIKIMDEKIKITYKKLDEISPYKRNPRFNDDAVEAVAASIREFGFKVPIVIDGEGNIIAGHTRLKAAKELGMEKVPCIIADDLSEEQVKAFRLADNKVGELADWDFDLLESELADLGDFNMEEFGFESNLVEDEEDYDDEDERPEVKFTEELGEESNYIVLKFDTDVDWLRLETLFNLPRVKALDSKKGFERIGIGRVVDGNDFIEEIIKKGKGDFLG